MVMATESGQPLKRHKLVYSERLGEESFQCPKALLIHSNNQH